MARHNKAIIEAFSSDMKDAEKLEEQEFLDAMNRTIVAVELNNDYSTKQKLNIYSSMTSLSNCSENERKKYIKKVLKYL